AKTPTEPQLAEVVPALATQLVGPAHTERSEDAHVRQAVLELADDAVGRIAEAHSAAHAGDDRRCAETSGRIEQALGASVHPERDRDERAELVAEGRK